MASNPFFSGRIPQPLLDAIEVYRNQTGESKTEVLIRALAKYVNYELEEDKPSIPPIQKTFNEIFSRLELIEKELPNFVKKKTEQKIEQLEITSDNNKITNKKNSNDNQKITPDNKAKMLSTKDTVALIGKGCSSTSLGRWKKQNELPKIKNGYQIEDAGRGKWKVTKIDNTDN